MNTRQVSTTDRWIDTGQGRLLARCWQPACGNAPAPAPIVLFHDSLGCIQLWRTFPAALANATGRQVIAYDRLGFGQSDPRTDKPGDDFIEEEARHYFPMLCEQLGFDRFIASGHSVGGGMAAYCAAIHAATCDALVTISTLSFTESKMKAGIQEAKELYKQPEMFAKLQRYHGEKSRWVFDAWTDTWLSAAFSNWSLREVLPKVKCPTLVIYGADDEFGSKQQPELIGRLVAGPSQMEILPGAGHVPHRDQEQRVTSLIAEFIEAHIP